MRPAQPNPRGANQRQHHQQGGARVEPEAGKPRQPFVEQPEARRVRRPAAISSPITSTPSKPRTLRSRTRHSPASPEHDHDVPTKRLLSQLTSPALERAEQVAQVCPVQLVGNS